MALRGIVNSLLGGGRRTGGAGGRPAGGGLGAGTTGTGSTGATGGRRSQDEAIGRGVRGILGRLRR